MAALQSLMMPVSMQALAMPVVRRHARSAGKLRHGPTVEVRPSKVAMFTVRSRLEAEAEVWHRSTYCSRVPCVGPSAAELAFLARLHLQRQWVPVCRWSAATMSRGSGEALLMASTSRCGASASRIFSHVLSKH